MQAHDVAQYLKDHPQFFEDYADEIAEIYVPHPHGGHAIPIAERQILALRDKNAELAGKLAELVRFGAENDATTERLHRSTLALFAAPDLEATLAVLCHSLREDFAVPYVAVRLWGRVPEQSYLPELAATSAEVREYAERLDAPAKQADIVLADGCYISCGFFKHLRMSKFLPELHCEKKTIRYPAGPTLSHARFRRAIECSVDFHRAEKATVIS